jgi:hypothetical protein
MRYLIAPLFALALMPIPGAQAQQGTLQLLIPAPPPPTPPPLFTPPPVPSLVTPLTSPSYGVPAGVTAAPTYGSGVTPTVRYRQPVKPRKIKRRPRVSEIP